MSAQRQKPWEPKGRWETQRTLTGRSQKRDPGPQAAERWLRGWNMPAGSGVCRSKSWCDSCGPSQAWLPGAHPASTPCWLAGLDLVPFPRVASCFGCVQLCNHIDRSLLTVVLSSSDFDYICKGLFLNSVPASSHLHSSQPLRAPCVSVCHILVSESPGEQ